MEGETANTDYGNWISKRILRICKTGLLLFTGIEVVLLVFRLNWPLTRAVVALLMVLMLGCLIFFYRARWWFDTHGANMQETVLDLLLSHIEWDGNGRALDIGCGSGALTIQLAKKYCKAQVIGIDYWDKHWDYSQKQCEDNARAEGVIERVTFQQASASKLPFDDETFDLVVSNLTFHEVSDSKNKLDVVKEALRVVKKGGSFAFQDLFLIKQYYGTPEQLTEAVRAMGMQRVHFSDTKNSVRLPMTLRPPFMLGTMGLLSGTK